MADEEAPMVTGNESVNLDVAALAEQKMKDRRKGKTYMSLGAAMAPASSVLWVPKAVGDDNDPASAMTKFKSSTRTLQASKRLESGKHSDSIFDLMEKRKREELDARPIWKKQLERAWLACWDPQSSSHTAWDCLILFFVLFSCIWEPLKAGFGISGCSQEGKGFPVCTTGESATTGMSWWEWVIDVCFYLDIVANFNTAIIRGYEVIDDKKLIARKYLSGWFWVDIIATIEWDILLLDVMNVGSKPQGSRVMPVALQDNISLIKLLKVFRLAKASRLIARLTAKLTLNTGYIDATKFFVYVFIVAHILACLFFMWPEIFKCDNPQLYCKPLCKVANDEYNLCLSDPGSTKTIVKAHTTCTFKADAANCATAETAAKQCHYEKTTVGCQCVHRFLDWNITQQYLPQGATTANGGGAVFQYGREFRTDKTRPLDSHNNVLLEATIDGKVNEKFRPGWMAFEEDSCVPTSWRAAYSVQTGDWDTCGDWGTANTTCDASHSAVSMQIDELPTWQSKYIQAMYWSLTTMTTIGYGDRGPSIETEVIYVMVAEVLGLAFFAVLLTQINNLNEVIGIEATRQNEKKNDIVGYLKYNELDDKLVEDVIAFLNFKANSISGRAMNEHDERWEYLSAPLRERVRVEMFTPLLKEIEVFGWSKVDEQHLREMESKFHEIDDDDSGFLDRNEINQLMEKIGHAVRPEVVDLAMSQMDPSGDNRVDFEEFSVWIHFNKHGRPLIPKCPRTFLEHLASAMTTRPASHGDAIVEEGDYGDTCVIILAGQASTHWTKQRVADHGGLAGAPQPSKSTMKEKKGVISSITSLGKSRKLPWDRSFSEVGVKYSGVNNSMADSEMLIRTVAAEDREPIVGFAAFLDEPTWKYVRKETSHWLVRADTFTDLGIIERDELLVCLRHWPHGQELMRSIANFHYDFGTVQPHYIKHIGQPQGISEAMEEQAKHAIARAKSKAQLESLKAPSTKLDVLEMKGKVDALEDSMQELAAKLDKVLKAVAK